MAKENQDEIKSILRELVRSNGLKASQLDAFLEYMMSVSADKQDLIKRASHILGREFSAELQIGTSVELRLMKHDCDVLRDQVNQLKLKCEDIITQKKKDEIKWAVISGVFAAISFVAAIVSLLRALGYIG